jgi:hypothetical protein
LQVTKIGVAGLAHLPTLVAGAGSQRRDTAGTAKAGNRQKAVQVVMVPLIYGQYFPILQRPF